VQVLAHPRAVLGVLRERAAELLLLADRGAHVLVVLVHHAELRVARARQISSPPSPQTSTWLSVVAG
jgi:hypothetical protein